MGTKNVQHLLLAESNYNLLPPLNIKQGLIENFVRATDQIAPAFRYLAEKFPAICATKIKEGVFINSVTCMLYRGEQYDGIIIGNEKTVMSDSGLVAANFLGNKPVKCNTLAENILLFYQKLHRNVFQEAFRELSLRYFSRKLWGTQ
jgi:hypothetical protein